MKKGLFDPLALPNVVGLKFINLRRKRSNEGLLKTQELSLWREKGIGGCCLLLVDISTPTPLVLLILSIA